MEHKCRKCGEIKDVLEFTKIIKDGPREPWNLRRCNACAHNEYIRYRETRNDVVERKYSKTRAWKKTHSDLHAEMARAYRRRHPEKLKAQNKLNYALRTGKIFRKPCQECGATERIHAHHKSYAPEDWYNVEWLCYSCHKRLERKE